MKRGDSSNLNLLPSQAKFQAERIKLEALIKKYVTWVLVVWAILIVLTGVFYFGSRLILNVQKEKYNMALTDFKENNQEVVTGQMIKYRAKVLGEVLAQRYEYAAAFEKIGEIFSDKVSLSKFEIDKDKNFQVEVIAADKEGVDYVEDTIEKANNKKIDKVKKIILDMVTYSVNNGAWLIKMEVDLDD